MIAIILTGISGLLFGWCARDLKFYIDDKRKQDRLFRHYQDMAEREDAGR